MKGIEQTRKNMKGFCDTNSNIKQIVLNVWKMEKFEKMKGFYLKKINVEKLKKQQKLNKNRFRLPAPNYQPPKM